MARYRPAQTRSVRAAGVAGAYLVSVATLFMLQVGDTVRVPIAFAVAAPPLVYAALSMVLLRDVSPLRRVSWIGEACLTHLLLGLLAAIELMVAGGLPLSSGLAQIFVLFAPAPALTVLATPLVLAPFVGHLAAPPSAPRVEVAPPRPVPPPGPASRPKPFTRPASVGAVAPPAAPPASPASSAPAAPPVSASATPAAVTPAAVPAPTATPAVTPTARQAITPPPAAVKPAAAAAPAPPAPARAAGSAAPAPAATVKLANGSGAPPSVPAVKPGVVPAPTTVTPAPPKPPIVASTPPAARSAPPATVAPVAPPLPAPAVTTPPKPRPPARADDVMVRVSFESVASQLPAEAFVLPFDRLAESLKEPHTLLVPRRIVLAQMRDGAVAVDWPTISSQFPELALGISDAEFRSRYPELRLSLPVDEILAQLPADTRPLASAVLAAEQLETLVSPAAPPNGRSRPGAPASAPAAATPGETAGQRPMAARPPAWPAVAAATAVTSAAPLPASGAPLIDRDTLAQIIGAFAHIGTFEAAADRVDGATLVALVAPSLRRETVTAWAARAARFLIGIPGEVVTMRTARAVVVVAAAPTPIVVAAPFPAPVALLELRAARAAAALGAGAAALEPSTPGGRLQPLTVDARATTAGRALVSFGAVEATAFASATGRVYVFSAPGREAAPLGALAPAVCEALRDGGAELGRLVSIVFRRGSERTVVRPLGDGTEMLVASGPIGRPGRVHRDAERAATVLEGR